MARGNTPEGKFKVATKAVLDDWKIRGHKLYFYSPHDDVGGIPDFVGCWYGQYFGIELKRGTKVRTTQRLTLIEIRAAGGIAVIADLTGAVVTVEDPISGVLFQSSQVTWLDKILKPLFLPDVATP